MNSDIVQPRTEGLLEPLADLNNFRSLRQLRPRNGGILGRRPELDRGRPKPIEPSYPDIKTCWLPGSK